MFPSAEEGRGFVALLLKIDHEECCLVQALRCPDCGGPLDRNDHPRKLRGGPYSHLLVGLRRPNLCCRDCRHRNMPQSVVFLGRRAYAGFVVVLASIVAGGLTPRRLARVQASLSVSAQTVRRWRVGWQTGLVATRLWAQQHGSFLPPIDAERLPSDLVRRLVRRQGVSRLLATLKFLAPLTPLREGR
jgi:hypothetical protein